MGAGPLHWAVVRRPLLAPPPASSLDAARTLPQHGRLAGASAEPALPRRGLVRELTPNLAATPDRTRDVAGCTGGQVW